ncbi:hypothetical protein CEUSTIGMA_g8105.t1 [Chlamydomonas eustigma]|uniref:Uncharacterized protein n=1 Tax=Chlamydomonas eustigma TaxID=1157962 RepID=A0A250XD38_9CHLO|nr:hypothetical protein CEUSTIGMA_g8105.t1 [Chlamydomonas eustigma]|eukprot:GAX80670.1 hypothetical protein CEUSTIGMA_g8105.t1 [Chlamydomonas eustigma]
MDFSKHGQRFLTFLSVVTFVSLGPASAASAAPKAVSITIAKLQGTWHGSCQQYAAVNTSAPDMPPTTCLLPYKSYKPIIYSVNITYNGSTVSVSTTPALSPIIFRGSNFTWPAYSYKAILQSMSPYKNTTLQNVQAQQMISETLFKYQLTLTSTNGVLTLTQAGVQYITEDPVSNNAFSNAMPTSFISAGLQCAPQKTFNYICTVKLAGK